MSLDRDYIVSMAGHCLLDIEEQMDDRNRCYFHPSELSIFYNADEIYPALCKNPQMLLDFINEPLKRKTCSDSYIDDDTFPMLYDCFLNMTFYFIVASVHGKRITKLKKPDDHEDFFRKAAQLILYGKKFFFSREIIDFLKTRIHQRITDMSHTPEVKLFCILFIAVNNNEDENLTLLRSLKRVDYNDLYLMYRIAYHRTHPKMDMDDFLTNYLPISLLDQAKPYLGEGILYKKIPGILTFRLSMKMPLQVRFEILECLRHPRGSLLGQFLWSNEPSDMEAQIQIIRYLFQQLLTDKETDFIWFCTMMVFLYSCRQNYKEIIKSFSPEGKEYLINESDKFLATLRTLADRANGELDYNFNIFCAYSVSCFLRDTVSLWKAIKPLLLTLRKSKKVWIGKNLVIDTNHNTMYKNLASIMILLFDVEDEYEIADALKQFRKEMADSLFEMLKPLPEKKYYPKRIMNYSEQETNLEGFDIHCTEPNPIFRLHYLKAIADLGVSADGKGHTFFAELNQISEKDLSKDVKRAAKEVIDKLGKTPKIWDASKNKNYIKLAFLSIWQAHLLTLNAPFDQDEALHTRARYT